MPVNLYNGFTNKIAGETFRCTSFNEESFSFDWIVQPGGYVPFEHIHLNQDEVFYIKSGELRIIIDGKEYIAGEGQRISVPKGKPHIAYNNKQTPLHCEVEYRPGLDTYKFFQCFAGLTIDGDTTKNGTVNIPKMLYFGKKMKIQCGTRPAKIPAPFLSLVSNFFFIIGGISGWNKLFTKYTGEK